MPPKRSLRTLLLIVIAGLMAAQPALAQETVGTFVDTHFWLGRPLAAGYNPTPSSGYPYGWHRNNQSPIHHGVDILSRRGTPAVAAADGLVYYAGSDIERVFGEYANFYGNLVIIQHDFDAPEGGRVFTLYGHLYAIEAAVGDRVVAGQQIGQVGATGIALGSHLHFEVRLGNPDDYYAVRNPELWTIPVARSGTLIGRMINADGSLAAGVRYAVTTTKIVLPGYTYADGSVRSDPAYNENFAMGDLSAGCYRLVVRNRYSAQFCIEAGKATYIDVQLK
jgi:murein DD-endopeptidase MepM/ murein hydrolase activator NlpD